MVKKNLTTTWQQDDYYGQYNNDHLECYHPQLFTAQYWQQQNAIVGSAQGRGTTWFIQAKIAKNSNAEQWVLRHYYRGGLIGKIINDHYLFTGQHKTRAAQEFSLLIEMIALDLPVPTPIAYGVRRRGLFYQADLLTSRIQQAKDLVAMLSNHSIADTLWFDIGKVIKSFHQHNIYHHDLNAHNVLIDNNNKVWLIDFDRGEQRKTSGAWQQQNMERLLRSFRKEQQKIENFHWHEDNWQQLLLGYNS